MRVLKKSLLLGVALACTLTLTGCWDVHDISDRTPALAMGFDHDQDGWHVTLADAVLAQGESSTYAGITHTGAGPTLLEAIESLRTRLARRIYLGSVKIYVLGQGVLISPGSVQRSASSRVLCLYSAVYCRRCARGGTSTSRAGGFGVGIISRKLACPSMAHCSLPRLAAGAEEGGNLSVPPLAPLPTGCAYIFSPDTAPISSLAERVP